MKKIIILCYIPSFINDREIKRFTSIKYLGVLIDEHLPWKEHIMVDENKIKPPAQSKKSARKYGIKKPVFFLYT